MIIALYAAIAMVAQDILSVLLTQAQARDRALLSGVLDTAGWLVTIFTTTWSVTAIQGHDLSLKLAVIGAVSAANFVGSYSGVLIGKRYIKAPAVLGPRVEALEKRVEELEAGHAAQPRSAGGS